MKYGFDFSCLTPAERIMLAEDLWDSLASDHPPLPLTPTQGEELDRRLTVADRGEMSYSCWADVKGRLHRPK